MASEAYLLGRKKYQRPQAMLWSENSGTLINDMYIPNGLEIGANPGTETDPNVLDQFIILSDDNRAPIDFKPIRIENRKRMINGRMRSYHVADKLTISTSWDMLPSRSFSTYQNFSSSGVSDLSLNTGKRVLDPSSTVTGRKTILSEEYTTDGGAGGVEILDWYEKHQGPFWVFLAYDKYTSFGRNEEAYENLPKYNQAIEMYISDFSYSVVKRGGSNYDFWNISVALEEV